MIWLDTPVGWQSGRDPGEWDPEKMTMEQWMLARSKWHNWYQADIDYGQTTLYFFIVGIGLAALLRWGSWAIHKFTTGKVETTKRPSTFDRLVGLLAFTTSKQWRIAALNWNSPPAAAIAAVAVLVLFMLVLLLAARPYYWPDIGMGHSPPIATRSGWISIAIMPFMIAFATKVNYIGLLTRTSHERLQVFHRWSATVMYITSLVHTFPFIINSIKYGMMEMEWSMSSFYWTGVAALVPQTILIASSWGYFRNSHYEVFKKLHFVSATVFLVALFIHCDWTLTSWHYFWSTLAIYGSAWVVRFVFALFTPGTATIRALPGQFLVVRIQVRSIFTYVWNPGQHVFVRFLLPSLHWGTTHPFTVANLRSKSSELELVLRVCDGTTQALYDKAVAAGEVGARVWVWVDGPYGHSGLAEDLRRFDRVLFLSGGSGATFTSPLFLDLLENRRDGATTRFVAAVRDDESLGWFDRAIKAMTMQPGEGAAVDIHVTRHSVDDIDPEKGPEPASDAGSESAGGLKPGRPDIDSLVRDACAAPGRVAIVACGPDEFAFDVRAAVASEQLRVARGRSEASEVFLHVENYSW